MVVWREFEYYGSLILEKRHCVGYCVAAVFASTLAARAGSGRDREETEQSASKGPPPPCHDPNVTPRISFGSTTACTSDLYSESKQHPRFRMSGGFFSEWAGSAHVLLDRTSLSRVLIPSICASPHECMFGFGRTLGFGVHLRTLQCHTGVHKVVPFFWFLVSASLPNRFLF